MSVKLVYRQGGYFKLNDSLLPEKAKSLQEKEYIYAAMHMEFAGSIYNDKYKHMSALEKLEVIDQFTKDLVANRYK